LIAAGVCRLIRACGSCCSPVWVSVVEREVRPLSTSPNPANRLTVDIAYTHFPKPIYFPPLNLSGSEDVIP